MIQFKSAVARNKKSIITIFMCSVAMMAIFVLPSVAVHADVSEGATTCRGAGLEVAIGECYPGEGHTGSVCGAGGNWEVGCTGN